MREGGRPAYGRYGESRVIGRDDIDAEQVLAADQVLVGRNRTRQLYNRRIRALKGFDGALPSGRRQARLPPEQFRKGPAERRPVAGRLLGRRSPGRRFPCW